MISRNCLLGISLLSQLMLSRMSAQTVESLVGHVVEARSGESIPGVTVTLFQRDTNRSIATATSNQAGKFAFASVQPGRYGLLLTKTGYLIEGPLESRFLANPLFVSVVLTSPSGSGLVKVDLARGATVRGKVTDELGGPVRARLVLAPVSGSES